MKRIIYVLVLIFLFSCDKNETSVSEGVEDTQIEISDISGAWALSSNDEYFISFTEGGKYSFCFNNHLMGSGTFSLKDNVVSLYNSYSNKTDRISIEFYQNKLKIKGDIFLFNSNDTEQFSGEFVKTNESVSPSLIGFEKQVYGLGNNAYSVFNMKYVFISDFVVKYTVTRHYYNTGKDKVYDYFWYYVYRAPLLFTQKLEGDGSVEIDNTDKGEWPSKYE